MEPSEEIKKLREVVRLLKAHIIIKEGHAVPVLSKANKILSSITYGENPMEMSNEQFHQYLESLGVVALKDLK